MVALAYGGDTVGIIDDFGDENVRRLRERGIDVTVHPQGQPRPDAGRMARILRDYDGAILGTSQKISEDMFDGVEGRRVIATASVGLDHIRVPEARRGDVVILNTPTANAQSVAEYTLGCALGCLKRLGEGGRLYRAGRDNKALSSKPEDIAGKALGVIGAGAVSARIMDYGNLLGLRVCCWTPHP